MADDARRRAASATVDQAQGGRPLHPRARATTSTTSCCPACCTWRSSAARTPTRASSRSTPRGRQAHARRGRGRHRRAARAAQARLDADALRRHAGGARDRQGALPGPGGRLRHRRDEVHRRGRRGAGRASTTSCCQAITTPQQAIAPARRDPRREGGPDRQPDLPLGGGRQGGDRRGVRASRPRSSSLDTFYPRCHPSPLETCGCVADVNPATGQRDDLHDVSRRRTRIARCSRIVAGLPEQNIRIISPDIGGGFGNKVPIYPGYVVATAASLLIGRPVKWVEDRTENLISTGFARDYHMDGELAIDEDGQDARACASRCSATTARSSPTRSRRSSRPGSSTSSPARTTSRRRTSSRTARTRTRRRAASPIAARSGSPRRRTSSSAWSQSAALELGHGPGRDPAQELHPARAVPVHVGHRVRVRQRRLPEGDDRSRWTSSATHELRKEQAEQAREGRADGDRGRQLHRGRRRRTGQALRHRRAADVRLRGAARPPDRQGDPQARRRSRRARATRRRSRRSSPRSSASPPQRHRGARRATPTTRRTVSAPTRSRCTPVGWRGHSDGLAQAPREGEEDRRAPARGASRGHRVGRRQVLRQGLARQSQDDPGRRVRRVHEPARGHGGRARGRELLRPAEHDVPVRHVRGGGRHRPGHRPGQGAAGWSRWTTAGCGSTR